jgi:hypothetical protein
MRTPSLDLYRYVFQTKSICLPAMNPDPSMVLPSVFDF